MSCAWLGLGGRVDRVQSPDIMTAHTWCVFRGLSRGAEWYWPHLRRRCDVTVAVSVADAGGGPILITALIDYWLCLARCMATTPRRRLINRWYDKLQRCIVYYLHKHSTRLDFLLECRNCLLGALISPFFVAANRPNDCVSFAANSVLHHRMRINCWKLKQLRAVKLCLFAGYDSLSVLLSVTVRREIDCSWRRFICDIGP